ncbi:hypothetical protein DOY81_000378 [Sarcophaga bullata]|nr:hypothetical protein DOY81_000378 [Sarcophaga bullata]
MQKPEKKSLTKTQISTKIIAFVLNKFLKILPELNMFSINDFI